MAFFDINPVRDKCEELLTDKRGSEFRDEITRKAYARCEEIKARGYTNKLPPEAYTVHHWSHTWLGAIKDDVTVDVAPRRTPLPPYVKEADFVREVTPLPLAYLLSRPILTVALPRALLVLLPS
jgi:hypothetical protein